MDEQQNQELDKVEIEPLSDEDLEGVAGGADEAFSCSGSNCSNVQAV